MNKYLQQRAASWVTVTVLAGGAVSAVILFVVVKIENEFQVANTVLDAQYENF